MAFTISAMRKKNSILLNDLCRDGKGWILLAVGCGWFLSLGLRFVYPSMIPFFRGYFGFGLTLAGTLLSALWIAYAIGQVPGGIIGDRYGEGNVLVLSTALSSGAVLLVTASINLTMLFVGTIVFGFATGLYGPTRFTIFTDIYSERSGTAVGLTYAAGSLGSTMLPAISAGIASYTSWRLGYGWMVPIFFLVTVSIWIVVPSRTSSSDHAVDSISVDTVRRIAAGITTAGIPLIVSIHVLLGFVSQGFLGFYPTYLVEVKGFTTQTAAILFGLYFAMGAVIQPVVGMGRDRFGSRWTLLFICIAYAVGLFSLLFAETIVHVVVLTLLLSYRTAAGVITNTFIADSLPETIKGTGLGILRTVWTLIGAASPIFVGYLGNLDLFEYVFGGLAAIVVVAAIMTLFVPNE